MAFAQVRFRSLTQGRVQLATEAQIAACKAFMLAHLEAIKVEVREYPAVPANSRYVRTGTLFRSWEITGPTETAYQLDAKLTNTAIDPRGRVYSQYVQGRFQVWYHAASGWKRVDQFRSQPVYTAGIRRIMGTLKVGL